ncbi:hypothetical protein SLS58_002885 [Diplodia intermedia]|uniref:GED domain-containing protein n=1 Tax=Diplodia intermedia TaxID=856260 RepID=A0ABR3TYM3_9PEZI
MQAVGIYSGVPQEEPARDFPSIIGLLQWTAAPGKGRNSGDLQRRDEAPPTIQHYPRATSGPSADATPGPTTTNAATIITITPTADQTEDSTTASTDPDAFVPLSPATTTIAVGTTRSDAFIPLSPSDIVTESTDTSAFVPLQPSASIGESTATSAFVPMNPTQTFAYTTAPDAYVPLDDPSGTPITKPTAGTFVITTNIPGGTNLVAATVTGTLDPSQPLLITATGTDIPGGTLVITKTGPILAGPTTSTPGSSSGNADDPSNDDNAAALFASSTPFTLPHYILGTYVPTLAAVLYGILWSTILSGIAETAPFFRLARPGGATAKESVLLPYQSGGLWDLVVGGIKHRDWLVLAGTAASGAVSVAIALAAGVLFVGVEGACRETGRGADCRRYLAVDRRLAWAECGVLVVVMAVVVALGFAVRRRSSGLCAEATSVAGVAALMGSPAAVARMREAVEREGEGGVASEARFGIGVAWDKAVGGWTYGFTVVDAAEHEKAATPMLCGEGDGEAAGGSVLPLLLRPAMLAVFQLVLLGLLAILLYYWLNGVSSPLEDFLNSQTLGPKLMMSCFGIVIRTWWSEIARAIHTMEPYRRIALGRASAHSSILAPTSPHAIPAIFSSLRRRHFFPAYLSLLSVLSEILIVTLAAVPFNLATLLEAFRVSVFVSVGIICATVLPHTSRSETDQQEICRYHKELEGFAELPTVIEEAIKLMRLRGAAGVSEGPSFSGDTLRIEVVGNTGLHLTVVDLPGLISVSNDEQTDEDVEIVSELVDTYLESSRTIILAVVQANNDIANQGIIQRARKFDPQGLRTVGIITKPDLINHGTEGRIAALAKNEDTTKLKLGFFLLKNPSPADLDAGLTADERKRKELAFFAASPWKEQHLDADRVGIDALSAFLQNLLDAHIERELPKVRAEVSILLDRTEKKLEAMGEERENVGHLRMFLTRLSMKFMNLTQAALHGNYLELEGELSSEDDALEISHRLRAQSHILNGSFSESLRLDGQKRKSGKKQGTQPIEGEESEFDSWIEEVYTRTRGRELPGNYNHLLLAELFQEQSSPWESIARKHVAEINDLVQKFVNKVLDKIVTEDHVRSELHRYVSEKLEICAQEAEKELARILADEKREPMTYNHYYTDNIQKSRQSSMRSSIQAAMRNVISEDWGGSVHISNTPQDHKRLVDSLGGRVVVDMNAQACDEAKVGLEAYYKVNFFSLNSENSSSNIWQVARKTFVDNICRQVVERHILSKLPNILSPTVVSEFSDEVLVRIASEPQIHKERRARLQKLAQGLRDSLIELRK